MSDSVEHELEQELPEAVHDLSDTAGVPPERALELRTIATNALASIAVRSKYFAGTVNESQALTKIAFGAEIGLTPIASLVSVYMINGKPAFMGRALAAAIRKSKRHDYKVRQFTAQACQLEFFCDGESRGISEFTIEEAREAKLLTKESWKNYPKKMLFWRALGQGIDVFIPEIFGGVPAYVPEELGIIDVDPETGEIINYQDFSRPIERRESTKPIEELTLDDNTEDTEIRDLLPEGQVETIKER